LCPVNYFTVLKCQSTVSAHLKIVVEKRWAVNCGWSFDKR
jgi:hypothetical protein